MSAFRLVAVACGCASVMVAGSAGGASAAVTVGPDVTATPDGSTQCGASSGALTISNASLVSGLVASPMDGVVVRWRARMSSPGTPPTGPTLRIVRATGLGVFTGAGSAGPSPPFTGVGGPFAARLPIRAGDRIGIDLPCRGLANSPVVYFLASGSDPSWYPALLDGETPGRAPSPSSQSILVNADVEGDADHDGFGDETQDPCAGVFGSINGCPKADLALTKTARQGSESDVVTYTLTAKNDAPDPVPDATISDTLPAGATFVTSTSPGGPCSASGRAVTCAVGALASGASQTLTITARLKAGNNQTNTATISSPALTQAATKAAGTGDPNPANNTATATVNVASPAVSHAKVSPSTFLLGSLLLKFTRKPPVGTRISFKLSEPARATLTFAQPQTGRKIGKHCRTLTRANRRKPKCTIANVRGTLTFNAHVGTNKVRFQGRLSRTRKLKPGRYSLTITATDSAGNRSRPKSTRFTILRS